MTVKQLLIYSILFTFIIASGLAGLTVLSIGLWYTSLGFVLLGISLLLGGFVLFIGFIFGILTFIKKSLEEPF